MAGLPPRRWGQPHERLYFDDIGIFFSGFCAAGPFGSVMINTPFSKLAWILPSSMPSGS